MGEHDTSPVDMITRRYPRIVVLKPYPSCAQICVYCQRNWELEHVPRRAAEPSWNRLQKAMSWLEEREDVSEVLVTGGDPLIMNDNIIEGILSRLSKIRHVERIRFGTRVPVVLPQRITERLSDVLEKYHRPGRREICVVTHFEHPYEVTPESMHAVQQLRKRGISVYNQQVFTIENSRRFETVSLRLALRKIGVDPYYTFNAKGKDETRSFRIPMARLLQERKEEARLFPGLTRTDEAVFNLPRLGKNYLSHWQDRDLIMIRPDGGRVYEFHPWEKYIAAKNTYLHVDVPILEYLQELERRGENKKDYKTIWYYF
jgi:lysine 2,3-aminomutase